MIDKDKTYKTRDGREVRIYATDGGTAWSVHGAIKEEHRGWSATTWTSNGVCGFGRDDLIEVKPRHKRTLWVNIHSTKYDSYTYETKRSADAGAGTFRIACIKVDLDFAEGDGLD
jgi:hypothetical protein